VVAPNGRRRPGRGVGELEVAAAFEVYVSSFAARTVPIAAEASVKTRHGLRLVATPANASALRIDRLVVPGVGAIEEVDSQLLGWAADRWQHRTHYVANTRWWPPFCLVVDWIVAAILVVLIAVGVDFHH
jgi:hypothetical protein